MRWRIPLVVVLALFVTVSCDQTLVEPTGDQVVAEAPTFTWMNNPDNGNFKIYRDNFHWVNCWTDPTNGLRACHSTIPLGQGTEPDCGLQQDGVPLDYQDVGFYVGEVPESWLHSIAQGDVWVTIRDTNVAGDCFDNAVVVEGWGRYQVNDNDVFGTGDGANANTWRFRSHGKLGDYMYNGHWQVVCWPDHPEMDCKVQTSKVGLH